MQQISAVSQNASLLHGDIASDLIHPLPVWMTSNAGPTNPSTLQMNEEQHIIRFQSLEREHFRGEEIRSHHHCHVGTDEVSPACALLSFRRRWNIMSLADVGDRLIRNLVAEICHRAHNPVITPA